MWDTVQTNTVHLSREMPCPHCGHALHTYLACGDTCDCEPARLRESLEHVEHVFA